MDLVIRHVTERDLEAVHEILTSPHVVAGSLRVPFAPLQRPSGTPCRDVNMVATHADWIGKGVGRALLDAIVELADNLARPRPLGLFVFTDNATAIRLYERAGFVIEGTMPRRGFGAGGWMDAHPMGGLHDR